MHFGLGWPKSKLMVWTYYASQILTLFICSSNVELVSMKSAQHLMNKFKKNLLLLAPPEQLSVNYLLKSIT